MEHAHDQGADPVVVHRGSRFAETAKTAEATEIIVEGVVLLLNGGLLNCYQRNVPAGWHLSPAFGCKLLINGVLHPVNPNGVRRLNLRPGVRLHLIEVGGMVLISFHVVGKDPGGQCHEKQWNG